jgi:coenzyme F420-reducing hydrogenase beta subunit
MAGPAGAPRIPLALQQVFVASQQGEEVTDAPKQGLGFKIFQRFGKKDKVQSMPKSKSKPKKNVAPSSSSLNSERSGSTRATAADATRKAMKEKQENGKTDFLVSLF